MVFDHDLVVGLPAKNIINIIKILVYTNNQGLSYLSISVFKKAQNRFLSFRNNPLLKMVYGLSEVYFSHSAFEIRPMGV